MPLKCESSWKTCGAPYGAATCSAISGTRDLRLAAASGYRRTLLWATFTGVVDSSYTMAASTELQWRIVAFFGGPASCDTRTTSRNTGQGRALSRSSARTTKSHNAKRCSRVQKSKPASQPFMQPLQRGLQRICGATPAHVPVPDPLLVLVATFFAVDRQEWQSWNCL